MAWDALVDITEQAMRPSFDSLAVYGAHILDIGRSVGVFGPPEQLHGIRLEWLTAD